MIIFELWKLWIETRFSQLQQKGRPSQLFRVNNIAIRRVNILSGKGIAIAFI